MNYYWKTSKISNSCTKNTATCKSWNGESSNWIKGMEEWDQECWEHAE